MMNTKERKGYVRPEDVPREQARRILGFLNSAKTAEEIADAVEIPGERGVGLEVAKSIL